MNEEKEIIEDVDLEKKKKEEFDDILENVKNISEALELHQKVKNAVLNEEIDMNYLKYVENTLEDKLFNDAKFDKILPKVLLEVVCPELTKIEKFDVAKLEIENIGSHFEEQENYIDKICIYDGKLISVFGICESNPEKTIKYETRKFSRVDMVEAVKAKYEEEELVQLYQYDEYYIGVEKDRIKVFSERKIYALVKVEETVFDKIKSRFSSLFTTNLFTKKKYYPNIDLVYDSNPNRLKDLKVKSKFDAKSRMKALLNKEREVTRI